MSSSLLRIIPRDPAYVPPAKVRKQACAVLKRLVPKAEDVQAIVHDEIVFVDPEENFDEVRCPSCSKPLHTGWWQEALEAAGEKGFSDLGVRVPCCRTRTSLNDLDYRWPAGFARFVLEASEPKLAGFLDERAVAELEAVVGQQLRQIYADRPTTRVSAGEREVGTCSVGGSVSANSTAIGIIETIHRHRELTVDVESPARAYPRCFSRQ